MGNRITAAGSTYVLPSPHHAPRRGYTGFRAAPALFALILICGVSSVLAAQGSPPLPTPNPNVPPDVVNRIPRVHEALPGGNGIYKQLAIPPAPITLDFAADAPLEHGIEVTHIKFNHAVGAASDALNIRWTKEEPLRHAGNGIGSGEYIPNSLLNEPSCYVKGRLCKIKVRFEAKLGGQPSPVLARATIRAEYAGDSAYLTRWLDLKQRSVEFVNGVSRGDDGSDYVEFTCDGPVHDQIYLATGHFKFHAKDLLDVNNFSCDTQGVEPLIDQTSAIFIYTVLGDPGLPWYSEGEKSEPWVSALFFSVICRCGTIFEATPKGALDCTTRALFEHHGLKYDRDNSKGRYAGFEHFTPPQDPSDPPPPDRVQFHLEAYMLKASPECNCHDQAAAVAVLGNLVAGDTCKFYYFRWFGYMQTARLVGHGATNNPVKGRVVEFTNPNNNQTIRWRFDQRDVVGTDDIWLDVDNDGDLDRSWFQNHAFVVCGGLVKDACCGPFTELPVASYLAAAGDRTSQNEKGVTTYNQQGAIQIVKYFHDAGSETPVPLRLYLGR